MQKGSREELIRRYLEGEMSVAEEHDFLIDAAVDRDLRLELSAQQTIDRAFAKDRPSVDPEQYDLLQQNVQGFLAAAPHRRAFPSLRTGLITGLLLLAGSAGLLLLPGDEPVAEPVRTTAESTDIGEPVEQMQVQEERQSGAATAATELPDRGTSPDAGAAAVRQVMPRRSESVRSGASPSDEAQSSPTHSPQIPPDLSLPSISLQEISSPNGNLFPSIFTDLESMLRIAPERRIGSTTESATEKDADSIRLNLDVEWDLPE